MYCINVFGECQVGVYNIFEYQQIVCEIVEEVIVLFKNEGVLFLDVVKIKMVVVVGVNVICKYVGVGGSLQVKVFYEVMLLEGL